MGYTHYWHRPETVPEGIWCSIRHDFGGLVLPLSDEGVELTGGLGEGPPEITDDGIRFNGPRKCGHPENEDLVIPYPSEAAHGIGPSATAIDGDFYGFGVTVAHRCCNGSCCYEPFSFPKSMKLRSHDKPDEYGLYINFVKTGFRPYDVAVTAALLIVKRHLGHQLVVESNGADAQWLDARRICQTVLGYGEWFGIVEEKITEEAPEREVTLRTLIEAQPSEL